MNKPPKWFIKWFVLYGLQDDTSVNYGEFLKMRRIAWRAYRKGRKDMKKDNQK